MVIRSDAPANARLDQWAYDHGESDDDVNEDDMPPLEPERVTPPDSATGDVILIRGLPSVFTVGYDCVSLTARDFHGVREVPPGPHFVWVSHPDGVSTRCGAWLISDDERRRVHVLQWDATDEVLVHPGASVVREAAAAILAAEADDDLLNLVAYNDPAPAALSDEVDNNNLTVRGEMWKEMTVGVSAQALDRIVGPSPDGTWLVHTTDRVGGEVRAASEVALDNHLSWGTSGSGQPSRELSFVLHQVSKTYDTASWGAERTLDATDATGYIMSRLEHQQSSRDGDLRAAEDDILADMAFAYTVGMLLGNDACIQQWWHTTVRLMLRAHLLPARNARLTGHLLLLLRSHLDHSIRLLDTSVLDYIGEAKTRDLRLALTVYTRRFTELTCSADRNATSLHLAMGHSAIALTDVQRVVTQEPLRWDLWDKEYARTGMATTEEGERVEVDVVDLAAEHETGEWAPEVVDLDDDGRDKGRISWD